jgi:hypothetical protein
VRALGPATRYPLPPVSDRVDDPRMSRAQRDASAKLGGLWPAARNPSFVGLAGAVVAVFALVARTWATAWTTADLIACLVVAAVLIVAGTTAGLVEKNIDQRGLELDEGIKDTGRGTSFSSSPPGHKNAHDTVKSRLLEARYDRKFMIAHAPGGEHVFVLLPPDDFAQWKTSQRISAEYLEGFRRELARDLNLQVSILETPGDWSADTAPPERLSG